MPRKKAVPAATPARSEMTVEQEVEQDVSRLQAKIKNVIAAAEQKVTDAETELNDLRTQITTAEANVKQARAAYVLAQKRFKKMGGFVESLGAAAATAVPGAKKLGRPKGSKNKNTVQQANGNKKSVPPPAVRRRGGRGSDEMTVPERIAQVMGRQVMSAGEVVAAMAEAGHPINSSNPQSYMSSTLYGNLMVAESRAAQNLKMASDGKEVKLHRFTNVSHGKYRVATGDDLEKELAKLVEAGDAVMRDSAADKIFERANIDVRPAVPQHNFGAE